jgi:hypothetical protein
MRTNSYSDLDPISPELALIDPELRRRARSELSAAVASPPQAIDTSEPARSATRSAGAQATIVARSRTADHPFERGVDHSVPTPDGSSARRLHWRSRVVLFALVALIGAVGFAAAVHVSDRGADHKTVQPQTQGRVDTRESSQAPPKGQSHARRDKTSGASTTRQQKQTDQNRATSKPGAARPRSASRSKKATRVESPPAAVQTRIFVWPAVPHAAYYKVQFFRGGDEVFEALPSTPRLGLPLQWVYKGRRLRLVPGTYSWRVLPAFGPRAHPRYGDPIVRSLWVVKK